MDSPCAGDARADYQWPVPAELSVDGVAAILPQRRPTWTPAQLKAGVMNSSVPNSAEGGFAVEWARAATVQWSIDDSATWTPATVTTVGGNRFMTIPHPNTTGFVSLRAYADDWANNSVNRTIIRAYRIG